MAELSMVSSGSLSYLTDDGLRREHGVVVAFSTRHGGRSAAPYTSLNLAAHVGDDAAAVDENRALLLRALGLAAERDRLTVPEQVHGACVRSVSGAVIGMGAFARPDGPPPVPATDGLLTVETGVPLLLCFADCVPIVLVAAGPVTGVAVAHAGWRGALAGIAGEAARRLAAETLCPAEDLLAYVGPHIGACHYEVGTDLASEFVSVFGDGVAVGRRLDLDVAVTRDLERAGVRPGSIVRAGVCTAEGTDSFYSHRAEDPTGRHGALACIL